MRGFCNGEGGGKISMLKKHKFVDYVTTLFVFIMTCVVSFILSIAQSDDMNLSGKKLFLFLFGFVGSIICIIVRFGFLYVNAMKKGKTMKKIGMLFYLTVWSMLFIRRFIEVLQLSNFSIKHNFLSYYNAYQIFMLVVLIAQWLGEKLFEK